MGANHSAPQEKQDIAPCKASLPPAETSVVQHKLVLVGDSTTGKSELVLRFVRGQHFEYQESTIGSAFLTQTVPLNDITVKFEIWDTGGQERYHSLAPMYYRGAAAAVIVYDITNAETFTRAKSWVQEIQRKGRVGIAIALAGNNCHMEQKRKVGALEAAKYAEHNHLFFIETSPKSGLNVEDLFRAIAMKLTTGFWGKVPVREEGIHRLPLVCHAARDITRVAFEDREWPHRMVERYAIWCQFVELVLQPQLTSHLRAQVLMDAENTSMWASTVELETRSQARGDCGASECAAEAVLCPVCGWGVRNGGSCLRCNCVSLN